LVARRCRLGRASVQPSVGFRGGEGVAAFERSLDRTGAQCECQGGEKVCGVRASRARAFRVEFGFACPCSVFLQKTVEWARWKRRSLTARNFTGRDLGFRYHPEGILLDFNGLEAGGSDVDGDVGHEDCGDVRFSGERVACAAVVSDLRAVDQRVSSRGGLGGFSYRVLFFTSPCMGGQNVSVAGQKTCPSAENCCPGVWSAGEARVPEEHRVVLGGRSAYIRLG